MCTYILKVTQLAFSCLNSTIYDVNICSKSMLLCEELTDADKISKNNWKEVKCWKWSSLRLIVQKFVCWFISLLFVVVFLSGVMVSCLKEIFWFLCFIVDFRKVPKHFLSFNTDESISAVLIKSGFLLYFNRVC